MRCPDCKYYIPFAKNQACKLKYCKYQPNYKGFVLHILEWEKNNIAYSLRDLKRLRKKYNIKESE
jgi:hypothetical protein